MRDDPQSSEEQFQMEDPVWRLLNGVYSPAEDPTQNKTSGNGSAKLLLIFTLIFGTFLLAIRYWVFSD